MSSPLFSSYKAVGYVTDGNGFCVNRLGEETFLVTTIGKSFQVYRFDKLNVCLVSRPANAAIGPLQAIGHEVFCAVGSRIVVYSRTQIVREYTDHKHPVVGLLLLGNNLISYDQDNNIKVFDTKARCVTSEMQSLQPATITSIMHPATYLNKIVIGYSNGQMELWNFSSKKIIHTFNSHTKVLGTKRNSEDVTIDFLFSEDGSRANTTGAAALPAITSMEQSPACDVVAIGFYSGDILLMNLKLDRVLFCFRQDGGAVKAISFRSDAAADRFPFMATSSVDGRIHIWNLGSTGGSDANRLERKLQCSMEDAHGAAITGLHFMHGEPILVSASVDNSIKVWIFDAPDGSARLLRSREGHSGCPLRIRYYGGTTSASLSDGAEATSCEIVSAGSDCTVRLFNTALESQNRELSQKPILKKLGLRRRNEHLPVVTGFDSCDTRQRDWANMVTIHKNHANAYLWRFKQRSATEMILRQSAWPRSDRLYSGDRAHHSTAVAMSTCGNFCVIGSRGGPIYLYNVQSGLPRGAFPSKKSSSMKKGTIQQREQMPGNVLYEQKKFVDMGKGIGANSLNPVKPALDALRPVIIDTAGHSQEVTGLFIDAANTIVVSCGLDGLLIFWDFRSYAILNKVVHKTPLAMMQGFRDGGFVAVSAQDRVVRVYDASTGKLSRRFSGHSREVTDMAFSPDGRRLMTSSLDSTLRVWDMPTGRCLSWLSFASPVLSMTVSHSGEFLCVAQADKEGIYMYVDRSLYETVHFWKEPTAPVSVEDCLVSADTTSDEAELAMTTEADEASDIEEEDKEGGHLELEGSMEITPTQAQIETGAVREGEEQRGSQAITLAAVPRAYWTALFHLEAIKLRNRPVAAPVAPASAPFFLPTVVQGGATPSFPTPAEYQKLVKKSEDNNDSKVDEASVLQAAKKPRTEPIVARGRAVSEEDEAAVAKELAAMGTAWDDDDNAFGEPDNDDGLEETAPTEQDKDAEIDEATVSHRIDRQSTSRIISRKTAIPRCKLVAHILKEFPETLTEEGFGAPSGIEDSDAVITDGPIMNYLKGLAPPAVDLEIRSLCTHESDEEGFRLLISLLRWLRGCLRSGQNFEILQAYLHRTVVIYSELIIKVPALNREMKELKGVLAGSSERFRHLVQSNLCILKMLAGLPPT